MRQKGGDSVRRLGEEPKGESPMLRIRVTAETLKKIKTLARKHDQTASEYVRECLEKCIERELKA
jgi:predicted DNA-binding protein